MSTVKETLAAMLTENTGENMLDSGGAYGRHWQENQGKTLEYFEREPAAILEIDLRKYKGKTYADLMPCVSVFHTLKDRLELDSICEEFNAMKPKKWDGDYYGTSEEQCRFLMQEGFEAEGDSFNTYNWSSNHSQTLQGQFLKAQGETRYVLLQIHGGCDVRSGYTDAKLFKVANGWGNHQLESYDVLNDDCYFSAGDMSMDWSGEWINKEGRSPDEKEQRKFAKLAGATVDGKTVKLTGDIRSDW